MDLPSRTQWRVEFTLPPDKAYFESQSLWYNPQPLNQSYYVWMNAANKLSQDLEFIFPGNDVHRAQLRRPERPWPIARTAATSPSTRSTTTATRAASSSTARFNDFSGGYWHDSQFGYGHWAMHEEVPGQKFFRWPLSRAGAIWESLLTDSDGPYFEPQNGRLLDQNDHEFFAPYYDRPVARSVVPLQEDRPDGEGHALRRAQRAQHGRRDHARLLRPAEHRRRRCVVRAGDKEIFRERAGARTHGGL